MGLIKRFVLFKQEKDGTIERRKELAVSCTATAKEAKETLYRLSSLTEALDFGNIGVPPARTPELREIASETGYIFQIGVHKSKGIGVCKLFMTKDADCIFNCTTKWSMLIVWRGRIKAGENEEDERELAPQHYFEVGAYSKIHLKALEDSWILGVAIPPPLSWPAGPYSHRSPREDEGQK